MADRGFTIEDNQGIGLNLPPFMDGRSQLPANEIQRGRSIASLRIHVERGMKQHKIRTGVFLLKIASLANQIVVVSAYLSNPSRSCPTSFSRHAQQYC